MKIGNFRIDRFALFLCICVAALALTQCAKRAAANLPADIFEISVGMPADAAKNHLKEIAKLIRVEPKRQEVWELRNDAHYSHLAVGYDKEDRVRYITAFAKPRDGVPVNYSEIGDLSAATQEINEPNRRYTWRVEERDGKPAYLVIAQGTTPNGLSMYTHTIAPNGQKTDEDEEEEREERSGGGKQ